MDTDEVTAALARVWNDKVGIRDPRDLDVARRRAVGLPDDASPVELGRALSQTPMSESVVARCEEEYQRLVQERPGSRARDDVLSGWVLLLRDLELAGSREWWAYDRLRRRYLDAVASGWVLRPVEDRLVVAPERPVSRLRRWLYSKRR